MVRGGEIGRILGHRKAGFAAPRLLYHGERIELIALFEEEMIGCGTNGGTVIGGVAGKILVHREGGLMVHQVFHHGPGTGWIALYVEAIINCGINGGTEIGGGTGRTSELQEVECGRLQVRFRGHKIVLTVLLEGETIICGTSGTLKKINLRIGSLDSQVLYILGHSMIVACFCDKKTPLRVFA